MRRRGPGLLGTAARTAVVVGVAGNMSHRQQQKFAAQDQAATAQQAATAPPPPAAPEAPDYAVELEKLAQLAAQGIITQEEFEAKKRQVLGI